MSGILVCGPYVGEIGWELMNWQARVRRVFHEGGYDGLVVIGSPGKAAFYADMPLDYHGMDLGYLPGAPYEDRRIISASGDAVPAERIRQAVGVSVDRVVNELRENGKDADVLWPGYDGTLWPRDSHQRFIRYQRTAVPPVAEPHVVLVQRTRAFRANVNWPESHWHELASMLADRGIHTTIYPNEAEAAIEVLSSCDLAVGQSTGGLHLASLCGCPTMVWSVQRYLMWRWEISNRQRYETWWNPLGSPVVFRDVPQLPSPATAAEQVQEALHAIGRRTGSAAKRTWFQSRWKLRNVLRKYVIEPQRYAHWPWPLQQFVRYQLV